MSDYTETPVYRERKRRRTRYRLSRAQQLFQLTAVFAGAAAMAGMLILFVALLASLPGCTSLAASEQRELEVQARGCYCKGISCKSITSAAGQAAAQAAGESSRRAIQINQPTR